MAWRFHWHALLWYCRYGVHAWNFHMWICNKRSRYFRSISESICNFPLKFIWNWWKFLRNAHQLSTTKLIFTDNNNTLANTGRCFCVLKPLPIRVIVCAVAWVLAHQEHDPTEYGNFEHNQKVVVCVPESLWLLQDSVKYQNLLHVGTGLSVNPTHAMYRTSCPPSFAAVVSSHLFL